MGNRASCAEVSGGLSLPPLTAEPPPAPEPEPGAGAGAGNPGDYEDLGKEVKEQLLPMLFDGGKIVVQRGLSRHFQTMHTLTFGSAVQPTQWQFGATYAGGTQESESESRPILIGDMSSSGNFTAVLLHQLGASIKTKINLQTQKSKWVGWQGAMDYKGTDFTASLTLANPDPLAGSAVAVLQYLQAVSSRLRVGAELLYQRGSGQQTALLSLGGGYKAADWEASARLGLHAWQLTYVHRLRELALVAECDGNLMQAETMASLGFRLELGKLTVRGKVDSHGSVGSVVERRLDPLPASLMLSGQINHWTDEGKVGMALIIG